MTFPITVKSADGAFVASVAGDPSLTSHAVTRETAIDKLRGELSRLLATRELVIIDVPQTGVTSFAGIFRDDPTLDEMVEEIYRQRDAERPQ